MAQEQFVPVTADDWYQRRRQDAEGKFFRQVADQGPRKGQGGSTRQGIYVLTADGELGRWLLVAVTAAIAGGIAWWITHEHEKWDQAALGMVLGGALGNILDRVRFGYVVDFADLHFGDWRPFLVFNVADAAISIGVVILLLRAFLARPKAPEETIDHA